MNRNASVRAQLTALATITCSLFLLALGGATWQMQSAQGRLLGFVDGELAMERELTKAYAQGLQMGQALRNILIDPANPKAYENLARAEAAFDEAMGRVKGSPAFLQGGDDALRSLEDAQGQWAPLRARVSALVRAGDGQAARALLIGEETPAWRTLRGLLLDQIAFQEERSVGTKHAVVAELDRARTIAAALGIAALLACVGVSVHVIRDLFRRLGGEPSYAAEVARRIAAGDLSQDVQVRRGGEASLLAAMRSMQEGLIRTIDEIRHHARSVSSDTAALRANESQVAESSSRQSEAGGSIAAAVEEMTVSIGQVAEHADAADQLTGNAAAQLASSIAVINTATEDIAGIAERMSASAHVMADLGSSAESISDVVRVIQEVAEQTNLLALNAAIEAARAGDQGRGFAVVADEVRKLAERTAQSTGQISSMVVRVQESAAEAVRSMDGGRSLADRGAGSAVQAREAVAALQSASARAREAVASITEALREQRAASNAIAQEVEMIARMSEQNHAATRDSLARAEALHALALALEKTVDHFRLR